MIKEINLNFLIKIFKSFWWKILLFAIVIAIAVGAWAHFSYVPTYSSSVRFYVLNLSMSSEYTTQSLISAAQSLSNDYIEIIRGDEMTTYISERLAELGYGKISPDAVKGSIQASSSSSSSTFTVSVTSGDPEIAYAIAKIIADDSADIVNNTTKPYLKLEYYKISGYTTDINGERIPSYSKIESLDYDCYQVLSAPKPAYKSSSDATTSALIAGAVAAVVAYAFFLLRRLLETVIRTEENIKDIVSAPIIGTIPYWEPTVPSTPTESQKPSEEETK